jgi:predicted O-methyltransferase YrrM
MINTLKLLLKKGLKQLIQFYRKYKVRNTLAQLAKHQHPQLSALGIALLESLSGELSAQEQDAISLIENRRSFLLGADKEIEIIDYGVGSSSSNRTREEMERGVRAVVKVGKITEASKHKFWAIVLFKIIRKLKPLSCVELGSCVGISASYQAQALNINGKGTLVTLEGSHQIANVAKETFKSLGINNVSVIEGPFQKTLASVLETSKPIDFFFNDGHHDHDAVIHYFNQVVPYLSNTAVIVFDDISWSPGMRKAWEKIEADGRVFATINLFTIGIVIISDSLSTKERFNIPIYHKAQQKRANAQRPKHILHPS